MYYYFIEIDRKGFEGEYYESRQIHCLAKMSYGEARDESDKGIAATVFVALNRTKDGRFPDTPCKVVQQKGQLS